MGCFSGGKAPSYNPPNIQLPSASELYSQAYNFGNQYQPNAMGARESALHDLSLGNQYYAGYQPTSMESALQHQNFANIWPDTEAYMKNIYGQSGMASSPVEAAMLGRQYGNLQTQIGQYLTDLGNNRANFSLSSRLGIDPQSILNPYVQTGMNQANNQANLTMGQYNAQYQNDLMNYQNKQQSNQAMGGLLGGAAGLALAPFTGGMSMAPFLAGIGSQVGTMAGGGAMNPMALIMSGMGAAQNFQNPFGSVNVPGTGSVGTYGMSFNPMPSNGGYSNVYNVFGNGR